MSDYASMAGTTLLIGNQQGPVRDPLARHVRAVTEWMERLARRNGITDDLKVRVGKRTGVTSLEKVKSSVDEKIEEGDWPDDAPLIEEVSEHTESCPLLPDRQWVESTKTGLKSARLSTGERVIRLVTPLSLDSRDQISVLVVDAGTEEAIDDFDTIGNGIYAGIELEPGVYSARLSMGRLALKDDVDLSETPAIHPKADSFFRSVGQFFEDPSPYTRFNQPGLKTWLLYGTYGTGKSTMVENLARRMEDKCAVIFASGSTKLRKVAEIAADQSVPTILVVSEAETVLNDSEGQAPSEDASAVGASSEMLNFLDGIDQPRNTAGTALIMTTNRPTRISNRILKRTGRINERVRVGSLEGDYAADCAEFYLPEDSDVSEEALKDVASGRVGDDIKSIVEGAIRIAVEKEEPINDAIFRQAGQEMKEAMQEIENFDGMEDESHEFSENSGVGFGDN